MNEDVLATVCDEVEAVFVKHGGLSAAELDAVFGRLRGKAGGQQPAAKAEGTLHATQQPGEGFWAIAPGAADVSEGMVWVKSGGLGSEVGGQRSEI